MRPEDSFLERLSERDRRDSEITPGTLEGHFWVLYQFPGEALRETRNRMSTASSCTALVNCPNGYRLYWGIYVCRVSWLTRPYLVAIEPFRRVLYPAMLRRIRHAWLVAYTRMSRIDTADGRLIELQRGIPPSQLKRGEPWMNYDPCQR